MKFFKNRINIVATVLICYGVIIIFINNFNIVNEGSIKTIEVSQQKEYEIENLFETENIEQQKNHKSNIKQLEFYVQNTKYPIAFSEGDSLFEAMEKSRRDNNFTYTYKKYPGLGNFIESINGVHSSGSEYWILYINGVEASVGVSDYVLKEGDVVMWKYEKNKY